MKKFTQVLMLMSAFVLVFGNLQAQNNEMTKAQALGLDVDQNTQIYAPMQATSARAVLLEEGFDGEDFPPADWTVVNTHAENNWMAGNPQSNPFTDIDPENVASAIVPWIAADQDEWLITPEIDPMGETPLNLTWYAGCSGPYLEFGTLACLISTDGGDNWTELWNAVDEIDPAAEWMWNKITINLDMYADAPFNLAWQYVGNDGDLAGVDGVVLKSGYEYLYQTDFEEFTLGDMLAEADETGFWDTWDHAPGTETDAPIVDTDAASGTQSFEVAGVTDLLFLAGDKKTGKYQINFKAFVPTGFGGYYNFQHFEEPGQEYAYQVYFGLSGEENNGYAYVGTPDSTAFAHPYDTWFMVSTIIDLDNDLGQFYIDDVMVSEWQWSLESFGDPGTNQLGGIDFYAGAPDGVDPITLYDDLEYIELVAGILEPVLEVTGNFPIFVALEQWQEATENFNMGNAGEADLLYDMTVTYPEGVTAKKAVAKKASSPKNHNFKKNIAADPNPVTFRPQVSREEVLTYASDNTEAGAIGNPNGDYDWVVAARFPANMLDEYIGMDITQVSVFLNDPPLSTKIQVYGMGDMSGATSGELLYEQDFQGIGGEWNDIEFDTPLHIDGQDLWVGYQVNGLGGTFVCATDEGPAHIDGQWVSFGGAWTRLVEANPDLTGNWHIRAYVNGWTTPHWLSVDPMSGTLTQDEYIDVDVNINTANLPAEPQYGKIILRSNDSENDWVNVEVYVDVSVGLNEFGEKEYVAVYPNPAKDVLRVKSNGDLQNVRLMNSVGQVVFNQPINSNDMQINISSYDAGVYFIQIETNVGTTTQKIIIE